MKKLLFIPIVLMLLLTISISTVWAFSQNADIAKDKTDKKVFQQIRDATRSYKWSEAAVDAGFVQLYDCIAHTEDPSIGAMGVHFIYPARFDDQLVLEEPEVLVYEQKSDGRMKLVAVEYIIPAAA